MSNVRLTYLKWQRHLVLGDGWRIFVRPIRPDDEFLIRDLLVHVTKEDLRLRFFDSIKEFSHQFIDGDKGHRARIIELRQFGVALGDRGETLRKDIERRKRDEATKWGVYAAGLTAGAQRRAVADTEIDPFSLTTVPIDVTANRKVLG
jgi:hypothetical protein